MAPLHERVGPCAMVKDLVELGVKNTLQYDPCEDQSQNAKTFPILDKEPEVSSGWGDQYVNAELLLPRGDRIVRGQVICQKQEANGNPISRLIRTPF